MFLLILKPNPFDNRYFAAEFTFHNVSINTQHQLPCLLLLCLYLHSTMFLLIQNGGKHCHSADSTFTFHNVSINTNIEILTFCRHVHLHSTMFLLIRTPKGCFACPFHNLHSTMFLLIQTNQHYSERSKKNLHSTMFLLIQIP